MLFDSITILHPILYVDFFLYRTSNFNYNRSHDERFYVPSYNHSRRYFMSYYIMLLFVLYIIHDNANCTIISVYERRTYYINHKYSIYKNIIYSHIKYITMICLYTVQYNINEL